MEQYIDIQFSCICLSNEAIDGLKVTTVTIQLCLLEVTIAWFTKQNKKQQGNTEPLFFHTILPLNFYHFSFNFLSTDMIH